MNHMVLYGRAYDNEFKVENVKYKENFSKEMGKKPKYDLKEAKIYKTMKDAHNMASEVKYKADLKKLHKPVTDMSESLIMNHVLSTSQLASAYQYKKQYEKSKGHYHVVPDNLEQVHLREASELQSHKEYRKDLEEGVKGKGLTALEETPDMLRAKNATQILNEIKYKESIGKGTPIPDLPEVKRVKETQKHISSKQEEPLVNL
ncbi:nebulin isoform x12 [Limosa lapponica baueri]|uniref:Nebulin isoform x12 n=1 Tax=Limosa lapponica baueri TaxID=1758121 RepID=A0A2I0T8S5_LIMLA|nr:nebulin isoform x12 [Limosa lapponica baueri]